MKYRVTFTCYYEYEVEAEDENEAEDIGYDEFRSEMARPIACTHYDDIDIECLDDEEE